MDLRRAAAGWMILAAVLFAAPPDRGKVPDVAGRIRELVEAARAEEVAEEYTAAGDTLREAAGIAAGAAGKGEEICSRLLASAAAAYERSGHWLEARAVLEEATERSAKSFGPGDSRTTAMQIRLASAEIVLGSFNSALSHLRAALEAQQSGAVCRRSDVALSLATLAIVDLNMGQLEEAEWAAATALSLTEAAGQPDSSPLGDELGVLAGIYIAEKRNSEALPLLNRSIGILERETADDVHVAPMLVERGLLEARDRKYRMAEQDIERAVRILEPGSTPNVNADWPRVQLASVYMAEEKLDRAEAILPETVERQRRFLGPGKRLAYCIRELARLRTLQKRTRDAVALYWECLTMVGASPGKSGSTSPRDQDIRRLEQQAAEAFRSVPIG